MFEIDMIIMDWFKSLFGGAGVGGNYMLALNSLKYIITLGGVGMCFSSFLEVRSKQKRR